MKFTLWLICLICWLISAGFWAYYLGKKETDKLVKAALILMAFSIGMFITMD